MISHTILNLPFKNFILKNIHYQRFGIFGRRQTRTGPVCRHPRRIGLRQVHALALHRRPPKTYERRSPAPRQTIGRFQTREHGVSAIFVSALDDGFGQRSTALELPKRARKRAPR